MLHYLIKQRIDNVIKHKYAKSYARRVVDQVNKEEGKSEGMKHKTKIGTIKVSGLSHKKSKQSKAKQIDPRLSWMMIQNIYLIYRGIKNNEERNAAMLITSLS